MYVIDGIDVVATLVPDEATVTRATEKMQDREQESITVVDCEDPSATAAIEAYEARTVKSSIQKKCEKDEPKRCESCMNL